MNIVIDGVLYAGSEAVDQFIVSSAVNYITIVGAGGSDEVSIDASLTYSKIRCGDDSDDVNINSDISYSTIIGGAGSDTVIVASSATLDTSKVWSGVNDDLITIDGQLMNSTVGGGGGIDTVTISSSATVDTSKIWGGENDDLITIDGELTHSTIGGGGGIDTVIISSSATLDASKVWSGEHDDSITIEGDLANSTVGGGGGIDTVIISSSATLDTSKVWSGENDDSITIDGELTNSTVGGGGGIDTVIVSSSATLDTAKVWSGTNADIITIEGALNNSTVGGGSGDDELTISGASLNGSVVKGGKDDDIFIIDNLVESSSTNLASSNSELWVKTSSSTVPSIYGDGGNDDISAVDAGLPLKIYGGTGNDILKVGNSQTVSGGDGADVFIIEGTNVQILDFDSSEDQIQYNIEAINSLGINNYAAKLQQTSLINTDSGTWNSLTGTLHISDSEWKNLVLIFSDTYYVSTRYSAWDASSTTMVLTDTTATYTLSVSASTSVNIATLFKFTGTTYTYLTGYASTGRYTINLPSDFAVYVLEKYTDTMNLSLVGFGTGFSETLRVGALSTINGSDGILNTSSTRTTHTFYTTLETHVSTRLSFSSHRVSFSTITPNEVSKTFLVYLTLTGTTTFSGTFKTIVSTSRYLTVYNEIPSTTITLSYRPAFAATATDDMNLINTDRLDILQ
uniref:beta strand repeat-containing protein n=1 Tax=Synechococcus sp. UW106 TaxID=368495 RepID=UPI00352F5529